MATRSAKGFNGLLEVVRLKPKYTDNLAASEFTASDVQLLTIYAEVCETSLAHLHLKVTKAT